MTTTAIIKSGDNSKVYCVELPDGDCTFYAYNRRDDAIKQAARWGGTVSVEPYPFNPGGYSSPYVSR